MFQTRSINGESYSVLKPRHNGKAKIFDEEKVNHFEGLLSDLSEIQSEEIITSSQDLGWQNIQVLHMRHTNREMEMPALVNHSLILPLGPLEARSCASVSIEEYGM